MSKKLNFFLVTIVLATVVMIPTDFTHAQDSEILGQLDAFAGERGAALGEARDPRSIAASVINSFLSVLSLLLLIYLILGGGYIMMSRGNEENVKKGQQIIKNAIIGLAIVLSAYAIARFVVWVILKDDVGAPAACIDRTTDIPADIMSPDINQPMLPYCDELPY